MIDTIQNIDTFLFLFVNGTLSNPVTDYVMPVVTSRLFLVPVYILAMVAVLWKGDSRLRWMVPFSLLVILISDQLTATYLKNWIGRIRPCHTIDASLINLLVDCGGGKSLPSAHSANAFAQAFFWSYHDKKPRVFLFVFASIIALSRVFVGVHYPGDIIAGAVVGGIIGILIALLFGKFRQRVIKESGGV